MAVIVRPTALIVWLPLLLQHFWRENNKLRLVTHHCLPIGSVFLLSLCAVSCIVVMSQLLKDSLPCLQGFDSWRINLDRLYILWKGMDLCNILFGVIHSFRNAFNSLLLPSTPSSHRLP